MKPLCFVAMPFGVKPDATGREIDFEKVYRLLLQPTIERAGMEPLRGDHEMTGGLIHKPMFERLILCDYALADLTTANANVFYELGLRHGLRPASTVLVFAADSRIPFDLAPVRAIPYALDANGGPADIDASISMIAERLVECRRGTVDSPVFQLVKGLAPPELAHLRADAFRERVDYSRQARARLERARGEGLAGVRAAHGELGEVGGLDAGVAIDIFLSYRAVGGYAEMVACAEAMPASLARTTLVREQLAFALNRLGRGSEAEAMLLELIAKRGPSSETYGLLGRVYKDRWEAALREGRGLAARGMLDQAIGAYRKGFECDWRDAYPGVNMLTLMELRDPPDPDRQKFLPIVRYAVERRLGADRPDYWDGATWLELAVLAGDRAEAETALVRSLPLIREAFQPQTTARNLRLIREARQQRGDEAGWVQELETELEAAQPAASPP